MKINDPNSFAKTEVKNITVQEFFLCTFTTVIINSIIIKYFQRRRSRFIITFSIKTYRLGEGGKNIIFHFVNGRARETATVLHSLFSLTTSEGDTFMQCFNFIHKQLLRQVFEWLFLVSTKTKD